MIRPATLKVDNDILRLFDSGVDPKKIPALLDLSNKWRVYHAIRRRKKCQKMPKKYLANRARAL